MKQYYFSGVVDIFKNPRNQLIINEAANSSPGPDRLTFVIAAIFTFLPLPYFWLLDFRSYVTSRSFSRKEREPRERGWPAQRFWRETFSMLDVM